MAATSDSRVTSVGTHRRDGQANDRDQLRRDRWTLLIVLALFAGLVALIIWAATLGGGEAVDYGPMLF